MLHRSPQPPEAAFSHSPRRILASTQTIIPNHPNVPDGPQHIKDIKDFIARKTNDMLIILGVFDKDIKDTKDIKHFINPQNLGKVGKDRWTRLCAENRNQGTLIQANRS